MSRPATRNPVQPHARIVLDAVRQTGSQQRLADEINREIREAQLKIKPVVQQTVSHWIRRNKKIPRPYRVLIERIIANQSADIAETEV